MGFVWAALLGGPTTPSLHWPVASYQATPHSGSLVSSPAGREGGESSCLPTPAHSARNKLEWVRACTAQPDQAGRGKVGAPRASKSAEERDWRQPTLRSHLACLPAHLLPVTHLCIGSCRERRRIAESADRNLFLRLASNAFLELQPGCSNHSVSWAANAWLLWRSEEMREHCAKLGNLRKVHRHQSK